MTETQDCNLEQAALSLFDTMCGRRLDINEIKKVDVKVGYVCFNYCDFLAEAYDLSSPFGKRRFERRTKELVGEGIISFRKDNEKNLGLILDVHPDF